MNDDPDDVARAILADSEMQDTEAYLARGRAFALLPIDDLNKKYAAAFTAVAFGDDAPMIEWSDLAAELRLRRLPIPEHLVAGAMAALQKRVADPTPEHFEAVRKHVGRLREKWNKVKN
jgi:hypothetical protein